MKGPQNTSAALLVHACDRYEFLYEGFSLFFEKYWDFSTPINYYFATEEKKAQVPHFTPIQSGRGEWSDRLRCLLENIPEEYILYFQEDMWLTQPVDAAFFSELISYAVSHRLDCIKLHSSEVYKTQPTDVYIQGFMLAKIDNKASDFLMSHQVSLWKKDFLLQQLYPNEHPWRNERKATKRLKKRRASIYQIDYFAENGKKAINENKPTAARSEYYTVSVNGMLGEQAAPFIQKILKENPSHAYGKKLQHHFENKLTHDGKPKPRKEDVLQKIKRWLKK
ncbi:MAG: hypothetical protein JST67_09770 [Bacteroidetes bacterium]|nr:hypothetical protein [Bacteroidota bacterium]